MSEDAAATVEIRYPLASGAASVDDDPENPLARALSPLMEQHKQLPALRVVFLAEGRDTPPCRWLGTFARSPGERVFFFPGLDVELFRVRGSESGRPRFETDFDLDHVSLERGKGRWHVTAPRSKAHQAGPTALDSGPPRVG
jgi:hypothetical protein